MSAERERQNRRHELQLGRRRVGTIITNGIVVTYSCVTRPLRKAHSEEEEDNGEQHGELVISEMADAVCRILRPGGTLYLPAEVFSLVHMIKLF